MMNMKEHFKIRPMAVVLWALMFSVALPLTSCFDDPEVEAVFEQDPLNDNDPNRFPLISTAIASNPNLSLFQEVATTTRLELPDGSTTSLGAMLSAYGAYTVFAPDNDAMQEWLDSRDISVGSLKAASDDPELNAALTELLLYHICLDSVPTSRYIDGRFAAKTALGSYLLTKLIPVGGKVTYQINRSAVVDTSDIRCRNGYLNVIDKALEPEGRTGGQMIAGLSEDFTIFKQLFVETGVGALLDVRNDTVWAANGLSYSVVQRNYTLIAVPDSAFHNKGIFNVGDLANWLDANRGFGDERTVTELLEAWAGYHAIDQLLFSSDIIRKCTPRAVFSTLAPSEPMMFNYVSKKIRVNRDEKAVADVPFFKGVQLALEDGDISFVNGVLHFAMGFVTPVATEPAPVYWDFSDQPGWNDHPQYRTTANITVANGVLPNMSWGGAATPTFYVVGNAGYNYLYGNNVNFTIGGNRAQWVKIKTPTINKGKYKVWITYYANGNANRNPNSWWYYLNQEFAETPGSELWSKVTSNGVNFANNGKIGPMMATSPFRWSLDRLPTDDEDVLMNNGWKWATARVRDRNIPCKYLGEITVTTTGPQYFFWVNDRYKNGNPDTRLDVMTFIPVDMDQMYPKIDACGKFFFRDDYDLDSQPFDGTLDAASDNAFNCVIEVIEEPED